MKYELQDNGVVKISLDNGKVNAITKDLAEELMSALKRAENEAKAVVICGNPGMFCAGYDLKVLAQGMEVASSMLAQGLLFLEQLYCHPQPVVIACEGHAVGMGLFMLLAADYRFGAKGEFAFRLPEKSISMPFTPILKVIAKAHIDARHHTRAILQSQPYNPEQAISIGILDEAVEPENVIELALKKAEELSQLPAKQYKINKLDLRADELKIIAETRGALF